MCQLLGMNCASPTDFNFSFRGFKCRGGNTDVHSHGWGIAIYEGRGVRTFHDPLPCAQSPIADMVSSYPIKTLNMMAHIRYATQGAVSLENVHPFTREMWGIQWTFAHNGEVPKFTLPKNPQEENHTTNNIPMLGPCKQAIYHPVGDTDSEAVFCAMLNALRAEFDTLPTLPVLYEAIQRLCCEIVRGHEEKTIFNFLLGCGQFTMFAFSWPGSRDGSTVWNGLHYLVRWPPFSTAELADVDYALLRDTVYSALGYDKDSDEQEVWAERAVDLGCGSGQSGSIFRQCVKHLTGVDLSPEMAEEARESSCYDKIIVGDAECVLHENNQNGGQEGKLWYDFVFACDLFPYVGDLKPIFQTVRKGLETFGGTLAFSVELVDESLNESREEDEDDPGFVMQSCARFAHKRWYIAQLCEDFGFRELLSKESTVLRQHRGKDVLGALFVLQLPSSEAV
ncbi:hypothetical protein ACHAWC_002200 [Mediolabrus comicus]